MTASHVQVRRATATDAADLAAFTKRIFEDTFGPDNRDADMLAYVSHAFGAEIQARQIAEPNTVYLLLEVDGVLAACACLLRGSCDPAVQGDDPVEIQRFYVDAPFHGRGIATVLMNACVTTARELGGRTMWLGVWERNTRAIRFYEKSGMIDVGSQDFVLGDDVQTDRVMVLRDGLVRV